MATFTLRPCRVRGNMIAQDFSQDEIKVDWSGLRRLLAPTGTPHALRIIAQTQAGAFVGLLRSGRFLTNFLMVNPDQSGNIGTMLKRDPNFADRIERAFYVVDAELDSSFTEMS